jgi:hypothetical protein
MIEYNQNANGGTELIARKLEQYIPQELLNKFQIICDRIIFIDETKIRLFWAHDTPHQLNNSYLEQSDWRKFHKIIFISHHQMEEYINYFYNCEKITQEWIELLKSLEHLNLKIKQQATFNYS